MSDTQKAAAEFEVPETLTKADVQQLSAAIVGEQLTVQYTQAAMIMALAKKGVVELTDVYGFLGAFAATMTATAQKQESGLNAKAATHAAGRLLAMQPLIAEFLLAQASAGRA